MISIKDFKKINPWLWEIPKNFRKDMRVPARIYASEKLCKDIFRDQSISQLINTSTLPGIVKYAMAMPDIHEGYGFPIGGVVATRTSDGVISPGGIGFDINCGVRLLKSDFTAEEIKPYLDKLAQEIQQAVPSGLGRARKTKISLIDLNKVLKYGVKSLLENGYGEKEDFENCEANGSLNLAEPDLVSNHAKERGRNQLGTLGSGNHFLEIQQVVQIYDQKIAEVFGLYLNQIVIMLHTGSRGLGHQVCTDYLKVMRRAVDKYRITLPDRELCCAPFNSPEGRNYFRAMCAAANFGFSNRQMITYYVRKVWKKVFGSRNLKLLYGVAHNIAKIEKYQVNGKTEELCVHRKGATRAFPPGSPEIPEKYREVGQPVLIPGSMGTSSYVLAGTKSGEQAWYSTCHGSGRTMSRHQAIKRFPGREVIENLQAKGIIVKYQGYRGIAEEAPGAYKDVDKVVETVHQSGLSRKVAKLKPLAVIKGE